MTFLGRFKNIFQCSKIKHHPISTSQSFKISPVYQIHFSANLQINTGLLKTESLLPMVDVSNTIKVRERFSYITGRLNLLGLGLILFRRNGG